MGVGLSKGGVGVGVAATCHPSRGRASPRNKKGMPIRSRPDTPPLPEAEEEAEAEEVEAEGAEAEAAEADEEGAMGSGEGSGMTTRCRQAR